MTRVVVATALVFFAFVAQAQAVGTLTYMGGPEAVRGSATYERWVDEARMPFPDRDIKLHEENCPGEHSSCAYGYDRSERFGRIYMEPRHGRSIFWHELGHQFDYAHMNDRRKARFLRTIGRPGLDWEDVADEWFATAYAECARKPRRHRNASVIYHFPMVNGREHMRMCRMMRRAYWRAQ